MPSSGNDSAAIADAIAAIDALPAPGDLTLDSARPMRKRRVLVDAKDSSWRKLDDDIGS